MDSKPTVYLETTIPSYLTARPSSNLIVAGEQEITRRWWDARKTGFRLFVSELVRTEAARGDSEASQRRLELIEDVEYLEIDEAVLDLTGRLLEGGDFPARSATDAGHIAVAARHGMDYLLTWNCKHIANAEMIRRVSYIISEAGYYVPVICTPRELMGGEGDE